MNAVPGVVAIGDSITNGEGAPVLGVDCRSWAHWLALTLDVPFHNLARNGETVDGARREQLPRLRGRAALATIYLGANDVRGADFDLPAYAEGLADVLARAAAHADRVAVCTIPLDLGRPRAGGKVADANAAIRRAAGESGAVVVDLADFTGWRLVRPDAVHPTAAGQLAIADRAARALDLPTLPSAAVEVWSSPRALTRYALTSRLPALARDAGRRLRER